MSNKIQLNFIIPSNDFLYAGEASSNMKKTLSHLGVAPEKIKKASVSMYEAEINAMIHAGGGKAEVEIDNNQICIIIKDEGPGIPDLDLAMQAGYSTAPDSVREMGFGAGMGLPNMKRYADELQIDSAVGKGTTVKIVVFLKDS